MNYTNRKNVELMFQYHPPKTEDRKAKHDAVNNTSQSLALTIWDSVGDKEFASFLINKIQEIKMNANQVITYEDIKSVEQLVYYKNRKGL